MKRLRLLTASVAIAAGSVILSPAPAIAGSDPDLCNWVRTDNDIQAGFSVRLIDGRLLWLGPGFCTDPGMEVLRFYVTDGLSFQIKWRDPKTGYSGVVWVDGGRTIYQKELKYRILDIEENEKTVS